MRTYALKSQLMKSVVIILFTCLLYCNAYSQSKYFEKLYKWEAVQELRKVMLLENEMIFAGNAKPETADWYGQVYVTGNFGDTLATQNLSNPYGYMGFVDFVQLGNFFFFTGNMTKPIGGNTFQTLLLTWDRNSNQANLHYVGNTENNSVGRAIIPSLDGNLIIVGHYAWQPYAIKTDTLGNTIWEQVYEGYPLLNWLTDIIPVPNEEAYYVIGTVGWNVYNGDILVAKIRDTDGQMVWDTIYDFGTTFWDADSKDVSGRLIKSKYGGNIAGCAIQGFVNEYYKGTVVKFDDQFDISWYNDNLFYNCSAATIDELPNGDIITSGCNDPEEDYAQMQIIKLSGIDGSIKWRRSYGGSWHDYAYDLALTPDGGFLVAGRQDTIIPGAPVGHASAWVLKLNCMGLLTQPQAAFTHYPLDNHAIQFINQTQYAYPDSIDGGYYIWDFGDGAPPYLCGQGYEPCAPVLTHQYALPGAYTATLTAIVCTDTSVVQHTFSTQAVSIPQTPPLNPPLASEGGSYSVVVYPNPAQNTLHFSLTNSLTPLSEGWSVTLFTPTGQQVLHSSASLVGTQAMATHTVQVGHLPVGIYFYTVQSGGVVLARGKVAVVR